MKILVTGARGNVGRLVRKGLAGHEVLALTRSAPSAPGEVRGDLAEPGTLPLSGVEAMFLFPVPESAEEVVRLAVRAGVRRIVTLSSGAVTFGEDDSFHLPVERAVEASGVEWTHVRPGEFMLNKLELWGPSIRAEGVVRDPFPDQAWYPVHEADIADVAVAALTEDGHAGRAHTLNGPELISHRDQVAAISAAIGRELRFEQVTRARARELYLAQGGFAAACADFLLGYEDYSGGESTEEWAPDPSIEMTTMKDVTGRPARTFAQWASYHAHDFLRQV
ncbi:NAD(P)H-binding protein [Nonomuraea dietziae]|uniref:NAD(P)H-binding protein n=1 Tax=Nonomuraea dietziae TaxID=65515 RepID=UPI00343832C6